MGDSPGREPSAQDLSLPAVRSLAPRPDGAHAAGARGQQLASPPRAHPVRDARARRRPPAFARRMACNAAAIARHVATFTPAAKARQGRAPFALKPTVPAERAPASAATTRVATVPSDDACRKRIRIRPGASRSGAGTRCRSRRHPAVSGGPGQGEGPPMRTRTLINTTLLTLALGAGGSGVRSRPATSPSGGGATAPGPGGSTGTGGTTPPVSSSQSASTSQAQANWRYQGIHPTIQRARCFAVGKTQCAKKQQLEVQATGELVVQRAQLRARSGSTSRVRVPSAPALTRSSSPLRPTRHGLR